MKSIPVSDFSLKNTLECGQIFRFTREGDYYYLVMGDTVLKLRQYGNKLLFDSNKKISQEKIVQKFGLDENYGKILSEIKKDPYISAAISSFPGIRIMRQDPWECMISFICSIHSSVGGVRARTNSLSRRFGEKIGFDGKQFFSFPKELGTEKQIRGCGIGFRSGYLHGAKIMDSKSLSKISRKNFLDAREELKELKGIGDKVADCICLFSLGFNESFPIDRWVRRVMEERYINTKSKYSRISQQARQYFGKNAGYAQQFLFHYARIGGNLNDI